MIDETLWQQMAQAQTDIEFSESWLGIQCGIIEGTYSALLVMDPSEEGPFATTAFWPRGIEHPGHLGQAIQQTLQEGKGVVIRSDEQDSTRFHLAYPLKRNGMIHGAAAFEIAPRAPALLKKSMRQLQWGMAWLENRILCKENKTEAHVSKQLITCMELIAPILEEKRFQSAATTYVTLLGTRLRCDRVSIGFMRKNQIQVCALSHSAQFGKQMNLIRSIAGAMDEAVDQQELLCYPNPTKECRQLLLAHEKLSVAHQNNAVCTIPFLTGEGKGYGALTLERSASEPFDPEEIRLCDSVTALAAPILEEKRQNDQPLVRKIGQSFGLQLARLLGPGHLTAKLAVMALIAVVIFLALATGEYRITAEAIIEGEMQRAVVAPYAGYIYEAPVCAGDIVKQGDVMCRLDDKDLRLERLRWRSQKDQYSLQRGQALGNGDLAQVRISEEQIKQAQAQIGLLNEQLSRLTLLAPYDGIVVSGDLSQSLGAPVERGQVLFEVAPHNAYRVILEIDESDIGRVHPGQTGMMILTAMPDTRLPLTLKKITPVSTAREGRNYFETEAQLTGDIRQLRPGMEGVGKVFAGRRKLIWIWTHDLTDWLRIWVWKWWV